MELRLAETDISLEVPRPTALGMAYEDVTLTTSDTVKIKAYVIPARRNIKTKEEMMARTPAERDQLGKEAMDEWVKEMGDGDVVEVSLFFLNNNFEPHQ